MKKLFVLLCMAFVSLPLMADDDRSIGVERLPAAAKEFIAEHFKDVKVSFATVDKELLETTYEVYFENGSNVEFDGSGRWENIDCHRARVPEAAVPAGIRDYVKTNYPDHFIREIDRDTHGYEVTLDGGLELKFDLKFRFRGIDD